MEVTNDAEGEPTFRTKASRIVDGAIVVLLAAAGLQLALAGGSAFGASDWAVHVMLGSLIVAVAGLALLVAVVGRAGRGRLGLVAVAFAIALFQPVASVLAQRVDPAIGWFHGLGAAGLVAVLVLLALGDRQARVAPATARVA
jgi:hypothetical protein